MMMASLDDPLRFAGEDEKLALFRADSNDIVVHDHANLSIVEDAGTSVPLPARIVGASLCRGELDGCGRSLQDDRGWAELSGSAAMRWFQRSGWYYVPVSPAGVVVTLLAAIFCWQVFVAVDRRAHSVSNTLHGIFPFFVCAFLLLDWITSRTSRRPA